MQEHHEGRPGQDYREDFTFRLLGAFRDCLSRQTDEAVRLEMVEIYGKLPGDNREGAWGRIVEEGNHSNQRLSNIYSISNIVKHQFLCLPDLETS